MKFFKLLLFITFGFTTLFSQDTKQNISAKDLKEGKNQIYGSVGVGWMKAGKEGTIKLMIGAKKDVFAVIVDGNMYEIASVGYGNSKKNYNTHFYNYRDKLYGIASGGSFITYSYYGTKNDVIIKQAYGKPNTKPKKLIKNLKKHADVISVEKKKAEDFNDKKKDEKLAKKRKKRDQEKKYTKVYKESAGYRKVELNGKVGFIDENGKEVIPVKYEDSYKYVNQGIIGVKLNGKEGYVDIKNKTIIPIVNEHVKLISEGYILVRKDKKFAFYNTKGKLVSKWYTHASSFKNGKASIAIDGKAGYLDKNLKENWIFKTGNYEEITQLGKYYVVRKEGKKGLVNQQKKELIPTKYEEIWKLGDNDVVCVAGFDNKIGYYKIGKGWMTERLLHRVSTFKNGKASLTMMIDEYDKGKEIEISGEMDKYGHIKWKYGRLTYSNDSPESEYTSLRYKYDIPKKYRIFNRGIIKKDDKCGCIDQSGKVIMPIKYKYCRDAGNFYYLFGNEDNKCAVYDSHDKKWISDFEFSRFLTSKNNKDMGTITFQHETYTNGAYYNIIWDENLKEISRKKVNKSGSGNQSGKSKSSSGCSFTVKNDNIQSIWVLSSNSSNAFQINGKGSKTFKCKEKLYYSNSQNKKGSFIGGGSSSSKGKTFKIN